MSNEIIPVAFSRDNKSAYISDYHGNIKMINWQAGANSGAEFDLTQDSKKVGKSYTESICLTKDEKYLFVGSIKLVRIFETTTRETIKEFAMTYYVMGINLIENDKKVIVAEENNNLSIIDLETLEISMIAKNITNGKKLRKITVI